MSSHFREISQIFADCISQPGFESTYTIADAFPIKQLFRIRTIIPADDAVTRTATDFKPVHETDAILRVCNALIASKARSPGEVKLIDELQSEEEVRLAWRFLASFAQDEASKAIIDDVLIRAAVDYHYVTARPRQFDMFVHLSASEMFFIDGDSLLLAALSSPHVDWDVMQPLHVLYNAQALLRRLQARGARFHVVFFDKACWFWEKAPQKLFIRENLRAALTTAAQTNPDAGLVVANFESFHCEAFQAYVSQFEPEFFLMWDAEQLGSANPLQQLFHCAESDIAAEPDRQRSYRSLVEDPAHGEQVAFYFRCMLLWATAKRIKVAYASRIVLRENAVVVFTVTVESARFARAQAVESSSTPLAAALEHDVPLPEISPDSMALAEDDEVSFREQIIAGAVHAFLNAPGNEKLSETEKQLCEALVVTAYCTSLVSVDLRAQRGMSSPAVAAFLNAVAPYCTAVLKRRDCLKGRGAEFDLLDGHLLAAMVYHLRQTPVADLLDEDGVNDVDFSWQNISGDESATITAAALSALPAVEFAEPKAAIKYPHFTHDLVERLAKKFHVEGHVADRAYPPSLGNANNLSGWVISHPFDDLNDVVDAYVEEETQRNMTERERKRFLAMETAFVTDAAQQAESMGIRGFTTDRLALVCSDDSDDDNEGGAAAGGGGKADRPAKQQHAGQRNKKGRSKEDIIREEANIREANRTVRDAMQQVDSLLKASDLAPDRANAQDRTEGISILSAALSRMSQTNFGKNFDPGETLDDADSTPLKLSMWRLLVDCSGMREAEFVMTTEDPSSGGATASAKKSSAKRGGSDANTNLYAFTLIQKLVQDCTGNNNDWGRLERLRTVRKQMNSYDAASYLNWVYLSNMQLHLQMKLMCRIVKLHLENWKAERERARLAQEAPDIKVGTPLFLYCHHKVLSTIRDNGIAVSTEELDVVRSALAHFDFPADYNEKVDRAISTWQNKPVSVLPPSCRPRQKICFETPEMLQLMHMGHLLERPVIPVKDYRVVFNPDGWQRELLDIVDQRGSAVVCAPTSAGKTFISYYCMYNALKTSNTKVVVYVAPNRALINQAVADVCARYGSKKYAVPGKNVYGVHGGADYHRYHDNCQVLVTLPEVLETLLLAPKYKSWVERLDYVILDEIHTMESNGNGDVWERVLALLPCPFVALSATLGETQQLCGWLNRVQTRLAEQRTKEKKRDFVVHEVPSSGAIQRWNDIKKYIYLPPPGYRPQLKKLTAKYDQRYIQDLHPLSILTLDQLYRGFPPDISLVPSEVVQLYQKMVEQFTAVVWAHWSRVRIVQAMKAQLDQLKPETYFKPVNYITQRHARQYEADVKNAFAYWVHLTISSDADGLDELSQEDLDAFNGEMQDVCKAILRAFSQHLREDEAQLDRYATEAAQTQLEQQRQNAVGSPVVQDTPVATPAPTGSGGGGAGAAAKAANEAASAAYFPDSKQFIATNIISVLRELNSRDMGPTIVFSFEGEDCDDVVKTVVEQLEAAEAAYRQTEEFAVYRASMERKAAAKEAARKQRESTLKQKKLTTDDDGDVERADRDIDVGEDGFDGEFAVPEVLPDFTFIGQNCTVDPDVVKNAITECEKRGDDLAARAIRRGVGIHHAGVKGKLRRLMEILFRGRHCGVICATETLALGVHSPCRSVVLAGDHVLLNTTQFRQMMGRAGRRGLDYLGHLIFLSVSMKKITRLMTSSMTVIKGNVQMDPVSQLRLLQLYDYAEHRGAKNTEEWKSRVLGMSERLFVNPLFFEGRASVEGGNMEPFTVEFLQLLLGFFQKEGLHFADRPSSLGSLLVDAMSVFRNAQVGSEGFAFISMLTRGVFTNAEYPPEFAYLNSGVYPAEGSEPCTEAVAELMAYLFSVHRMCGVPLEAHRSVLTDPAVIALWNNKRPAAKQHRVVLAPLRACSPQKAIDNASVFRVISAFYTFLASKLKSAAPDRLPYMSAKTKKKNPIFGPTEDLPLSDKLKETAVPFAARDPFVAISGCGDHFINTEDIITTLRSGLFCDRRLLPVLDLTDGCRHDGAQVLINACVADFVRCRAQIDSVRANYRFTLLEELNGLTQSESFAVLHQAERLLSNLAGLVRPTDMKHLQVLEALFPEPDAQGNAYFAGARRALGFADRLHQLRSQIDKDYSGDQLRQRQAETMKQYEAAREARQAANS